MNDCKELYLQLMKKCLTNIIYGDDNLLHGQRRPYDMQVRARARTGPPLATQWLD